MFPVAFPLIGPPTRTKKRNTCMFAVVRVTVRIMTEKQHGIWHELRVIRERTGYSSAALAREAGLARSYVWQLENGERWPNATVTKKLADALHVPYTVIARKAKDGSAA